MKKYSFKCGCLWLFCVLVLTSVCRNQITFYLFFCWGKTSTNNSSGYRSFWGWWWCLAVSGRAPRTSSGQSTPTLTPRLGRAQCPSQPSPSPWTRPAADPTQAGGQGGVSASPWSSFRGSRRPWRSSSSLTNHRRKQDADIPAVRGGTNP